MSSEQHPSAEASGAALGQDHIRAKERGQQKREARLWRWRDLLLVGVLVLLCPIVGLIPFVLLVDITKSPYAFLTDVTVMLSIALAVVGGLFLIGMRPRSLTWQMIGLRPVSIKWQLGAVVLSVVQLPLSALLYFATSTIFTPPPEEGRSGFELASADLTWFNILVAILVTSIVAPIAEELFFRGLLYTFVRERWGVWVGALVSAFLFALVHLDLAGAPGNFLWGILVALVYERSKSLWPPIIIHVVNNLIVFSLIYLDQLGVLQNPF